MRPEPDEHADDRSGAATTLLASVSLFVFVCAIIVLVTVLRRGDAGLELSDEGFALAWITSPSHFPASVSQFGFLYHPIYRLVGSDLVALRQLNILVTWSFATALAWMLIRDATAAASASWQHRIVRAGSAAAAGVMSLTLLNQWIMTPNYNWLAMQSLMICGLGVVWIVSDRTRTAALGAITAGGSVTLAMLAKPTTGAVLGVLLVMHVLIVGRRRALIVALGVASAVVTMMAASMMISGSPIGLVTVLQQATDALAVTDSGHSIDSLLRVDPLRWTPDVRNGFWLVFSICTVLAIGIATLSHRGFRALALTFASSAAIGAVLVIGHIVEQPVAQARFQVMWLAAASAGLIVGVLMTRARRGLALRRAETSVLVMLMSFPVAFALGTNNNYWHWMSMASIFWMLASLLIVIRGCERIATGILAHHAALMVCATGMFVVTMLIRSGMDAPYRQDASIGAMHASLHIPGTSTTLVMTNRASRQLHHLQQSAHAAGFAVGDPMIDMTGHSPGLVLALGGRPLGDAWILGGYPGSDRAASERLADVPCDLIAAAWIIDEPRGWRRIGDVGLARTGIARTRDLEQVGDLAADRFAEQRVLLRPTRALADGMAECRRSRQTETDS